MSIAEMVTSSDWVVRYAVAKRDDLTPEQIERLSQDDYCQVRYAVAKRPDLTPEQIERLSRDDDCLVRYAVAKRSDITDEQIERLSRDTDWQVREVIGVRCRAVAPVGLPCVSRLYRQVNPPSAERPALRWFGPSSSTVR